MRGCTQERAVWGQRGESWMIWSQSHPGNISSGFVHTFTQYSKCPDIHTCTNAHTRTHAQTHTHAHMHKHIHTQTHTHASIPQVVLHANASNSPILVVPESGASYHMRQGDIRPTPGGSLSMLTEFQSMMNESEYKAGLRCHATAQLSCHDYGKTTNKTGNYFRVTLNEIRDVWCICLRDSVCVFKRECVIYYMYT